jgi:hypothetical protein
MTALLSSRVANLVRTGNERKGNEQRRNVPFEEEQLLTRSLYND